MHPTYVSIIITDNRIVDTRWGSLHQTSGDDADHHGNHDDHVTGRCVADSLSDRSRVAQRSVADAQLGWNAFISGRLAAEEI